MQRSLPILRGLFSYLCLSGTLTLISIGCINSPSAQTNVGSGAQNNDATSADKPTVSKTPLRIYASLSQEVLDAIARRWAGSSEQPIDLKAMDDQAILAASKLDADSADLGKLKPQADILIVESRWLATLAESKWARPLPASLLDAIPEVSHWERIATYGQRLWGVPLGTNFLVSIENKDEIVHPSNGANNNSTNDEAQITENETDWIVDRFLVSAAEDNPTPSDSSFLFRPTGAKSRLNEAWLAQSANKFAQHFSEKESSIAATISNITSSPEIAWTRIRNGTSHVALGWPDSAESKKEKDPSETVSPAFVSEQNMQISPPIAWTDSGRSLLILFANTNRQSAASEKFIRWLSENTQRQALAELTSKIKPTPENQRKVTDRPDRDKYHELISAAVDDRYVTIELQFARATEYRNALGNALLKIIRNESTAENAMLECHQQWESITDKRGRENQQQLLYRALELGKWEN